jgi:membrane protein YdbS with pleckstrin-like domain
MSQQGQYFPLNTPFKPSSSIIAWFTINFIFLIAFLIFVVLIPIYMFTDTGPQTFTSILAGMALGIVVYAIWAKLYYKSMWYELHEDEMRWKRGVIFRRTGIVPYNRITNIDIRQGPVMRGLGISTLSIQTAGYSGSAQAEIRIEGIVRAEELRELIRGMVRTCSGGDGTGTGEPAATGAQRTTDQLILAELKAIRELLEKIP